MSIHDALRVMLLTPPNIGQACTWNGRLGCVMDDKKILLSPKLLGVFMDAALCFTRRHLLILMIFMTNTLIVIGGLTPGANTRAFTMQFLLQNIKDVQNLPIKWLQQYVLRQIRRVTLDRWVSETYTSLPVALSNWPPGLLSNRLAH